MANTLRMVSKVCSMVLVCIACSVPALAEAISSTVDETTLLDEKRPPLAFT